MIEYKREKIESEKKREKKTSKEKRKKENRGVFVVVFLFKPG